MLHAVHCVPTAPAAPLKKLAPVHDAQRTCAAAVHPTAGTPVPVPVHTFEQATHTLPDKKNPVLHVAHVVPLTHDKQPATHALQVPSVADGFHKPARQVRQFVPDTQELQPVLHALHCPPLGGPTYPLKQELQLLVSTHTLHPVLQAEHPDTVDGEDQNPLPKGGNVYRIGAAGDRPG